LASFHERFTEKAGDMPSVAGMIQLLDSPFLWRCSRFCLNACFGVYRHRFRMMQSWGILDDSPSVLDVGCGIGQFAQVSRGKYLGIDLSERYIRYAKKRYPQESREFRCVDVTTGWNECTRHDIVLLVDFLHHIPTRESVNLLRIAANMARRYVVSFEPVTEQTNAIGRWVISHDRGEHIRPLERLHGLFAEAGLPITQSKELYVGPIRTRAILCCKQAASELPRAA
jgi:2-polyprenyl-3-methyl-5-hydroxy-6-metoxy-1,4-benzoquinol methylase